MKTRTDSFPAPPRRSIKSGTTNREITAEGITAIADALRVNGALTKIE